MFKSHYEKNISLFSWFRSLFTSRFYYPVYTILFLDMGLTLEEFALLNTFWAIVIVLAEVPSGALADKWGRKKLLVCTGVLMTIEISAVLLCPVGRTPWLLPLMMLNRLCSGLAEAAASGADEAIAYDSLKYLGLESTWDKVLARTSRLSSTFMIFAMIAGSIVYDQNVMGGFFDKNIIIRLPIFLNFISAIFCLYIATQFFEEANEKNVISGVRKEIKATISQTLETASWILKSPQVLIVILYGLCFDHVIRMFMTISNEYHRLIDIPISMMGLLGALMSALGIITPTIAGKLVKSYSIHKNYFIILSVGVISFIFLARATPVWGIIPSLTLAALMYIVGFLTSYYINQDAPSSKRATVLSFKGLSFNIAYGGVGIIYAGYINYQKEISNGSDVYVQGLKGFPYYLVAIYLVCFLLIQFIRKKYSKLSR